jgi:hypothetical protein
MAAAVHAGSRRAAQWRAISFHAPPHTSTGMLPAKCRPAPAVAQYFSRHLFRLLINAPSGAELGTNWSVTAGCPAPRLLSCGITGNASTHGLPVWFLATVQRECRPTVAAAQGPSARPAVQINQRLKLRVSPR